MTDYGRNISVLKKGNDVGNMARKRAGDYHDEHHTTLVPTEPAYSLNGFVAAETLVWFTQGSVGGG